MPEIYEELRDYLTLHQPEDLPKLELYEKTAPSLDSVYGLSKALEDALKERVWLKSGGYLVIQPTEALTVIDVNTGKYTGKKKKSDTFLKINLEAAREASPPAASPESVRYYRSGLYRHGSGGR